jgi:hypothetical protein
MVGDKVRNLTMNYEPEMSSFKRKGSSMQYRMTFVQYHVAWFHGDIIRLAIMSDNLQRPRLVHILCHVD